MAIDTRDKRQSAAQVGCPLPVSVLPSGTIDAAEREQISWTYRGIAVTPPPVGGTASMLPLLGVGF
jgi:hypothetical protein